MTRSIAVPSLALALAVSGVAVFGAEVAHAQPRTALIQTQVTDPSLEALGRAVDRVVRGRAQRLGVVEFGASPALSLEDIQLMVGCLNHSVECYSAFAAQLDVQALLIPSVVKTGGESIVNVAFFDGSEIREAARHAESDDSEGLIASLDGLLRELFGLPEPDNDGGGPIDDPIDPPPPEESLSPVGPIIGGVGAAALIAALGVGIAANNAEDDYRAAPVTTTAEVEAALDLRSEAQTKARAANAMMGVGAALLATGVILTIVLRKTSQSDVRVGAAVGPGTVGLTLGGNL